MSKITQEQFVKTTVEIIRENPGFIYGPNYCSYLKENTACVFGQVFDKLGVSQDQLACYEDYRISGILNQQELTEEVSEEVMKWADKVQFEQDMGLEWEQCLDIANEDFPEVLAEKS